MFKLGLCFCRNYKLQYTFVDPWIYKSSKNAKNGLCEQSSYFSSGPAAAVNFLSLNKVFISEGQAAKGACMQPWLVRPYFKRLG